MMFKNTGMPLRGQNTKEKSNAIIIAHASHSYLQSDDSF
jgi:hypothetical protein